MVRSREAGETERVQELGFESSRVSMKTERTIADNKTSDGSLFVAQEVSVVFVCLCECLHSEQRARVRKSDEGWRVRLWRKIGEGFILFLKI